MHINAKYMGKGCLLRWYWYTVLLTVAFVLAYHYYKMTYNNVRVGGDGRRTQQCTWRKTSKSTFRMMLDDMVSTTEPTTTLNDDQESEKYTLKYNTSDLCLYFTPEKRSGSCYYSKRKCAMTIDISGRLGNVMGQYATLLGLASFNQRPAVVKPDMASTLKRYFKLSMPVINSSTEAKLKWTRHHLHDWMEESYADFEGRYVVLDGYPCSWTFYHHIREAVLKELTFHQRIREVAQRKLREIRDERGESPTFIGVHVRRGDYYYLMKYTYNGVLADSDFFVKATNYFRDKYSDAVFVVVSDDMDWCLNNIDNSNSDVYFIGNGRQSQPIDDLAVLASCNHSIITIGTFGFWSAYLAGGETVYLTNYTMPNSTLLQVLKYDAFYLPQWYPIAANLSEWQQRH